MTTVADKRLDFIENYCTLSLHVKPDKWSKFATSEETHTMLNEFYEKQDVTTLVITLNPTGQLVPCLGFPSILKNKGVYFVKKRHENITKDNFLEALLVGDISPSPVEMLPFLANIYIYRKTVVLTVGLASTRWITHRILVNPNHLNCTTDDVIRQAHRLKNEMFVMGGKIKGKTLLPLPENMTALDSVSEVFDSSLLHSIETIIIDWSHQIRDILSKDSAQPLLDGLNPLPRVEFDFWFSRQVNLQCINEQLYAPQVKMIADILERAKSCYWPALKNVFRDVSAGKLFSRKSTCVTSGGIQNFLLPVLWAWLGGRGLVG
uniref:Dynein heavy chain tail domain-containing protein n=1 Tax=Naja naja TaxID=35670 RepID=A0A8C6XVP8_NAJNA